MKIIRKTIVGKGPKRKTPYFTTKSPKKEIRDISSFIQEENDKILEDLFGADLPGQDQPRAGK